MPKTSGSDPVQKTLAAITEHAQRLLDGAGTRPFLITAANGRVCHLRPTAAGFSLVSTEPETAQLGRDYPMAQLRKLNLEKEALEITSGPQPNRPTPEKRMQGWLIDKALNNGRMLPIPHRQILFLVDELVIQDRPGAAGSRRGDLVGLERDAQGRHRFTFIELKSKRAAKDLVGGEGCDSRLSQLGAMYQAFFCHPAVVERRSALRRLAETILQAEDLEWQPDANHTALGVVIWPGSRSAKRQTPQAIAGCQKMDLLVVGYYGDTLECEEPMQP